jgi:comEA protein
MRRNRVGAKLFAVILALAVLTGFPTITQAVGPGGNDSTININTATLDELTSIPGIGPVTAQRIIDFREENGPFKSVDDLLKVKGVGEKLLDKIRERVTAGRSKR